MLLDAPDDATDPGIACRIGPFPENGDRQLQRVLGAMDELLQEEFTMDDFAFQLLDPMREAMRRPCGCTAG